MANEEDLAKLKEGVKEWNAWREANKGVQPDLSNTEFSYYADLSGAVRIQVMRKIVKPILCRLLTELS